MCKQTNPLNRGYSAAITPFCVCLRVRKSPHYPKKRLQNEDKLGPAHSSIHVHKFSAQREKETLTSGGK